MISKMMKNSRSVFMVLAVLAFAYLVSGCTPRYRYERRIKHELASGIRNDSLFMGIYFGMHSKDFYTHCWDLNKKGLIKQGEGNRTVEYQMKNELKHPAVMNFYPNFKDDKIFDMPVRFKYKGWAPWNKELSSDKLQEELVSYYEKQYGKGFIKVKNKKDGILYVKIDGNRRITIFTSDKLYAWAIFTDLTVSKDMNTSMGAFRNSTSN
jgi:hypothetical protein